MELLVITQAPLVNIWAFKHSAGKFVWVLLNKGRSSGPTQLSLGARRTISGQGVEQLGNIVSVDSESQRRAEIVRCARILRVRDIENVEYLGPKFVRDNRIADH
jgi:hypothetical protein